MPVLARRVDGLTGPTSHAYQADTERGALTGADHDA
jgi:hypothetical protein